MPRSVVCILSQCSIRLLFALTSLLVEFQLTVVLHSFVSDTNTTGINIRKKIILMLLVTWYDCFRIHELSKHINNINEPFSDEG